VFLPVSRRLFGIQFDFHLSLRGFYPRGGGVVHGRSFPVIGSLPSFELVKRGDIKRVWGKSFVGNLPLHIAQRMKKTAEELLEAYFAKKSEKVEITIEVTDESENSLASGTAILLVVETSTGCVFGGSGLGEKGKRAEEVATEAVTELTQDLEYGGCVDRYLQDQLILLMSLAKGTSRLLTGPLTLHTETAIHFASATTGAKFRVIKKENNPHDTENPILSGENVLIECDGIGFQGKEKKPQPLPNPNWPPKEQKKQKEKGKGRKPKPDSKWIAKQDFDY